MGTIVSTGLTLTLLAGLATGFVYLLVAGLRWARDQNQKSRECLFKELKSKFESTVAGIHKSGKSEEDVRDAIEKLCEKLIGGSLDHVNVSKISLYPTYIDLFWKYEGALSLVLSRLTASLQLLADDLSSGVPGTPEKIIYQLKSLIAEITSSAQSLPILQKVHFINNLNDLAAKSYEDILAVAIINKVVLTQQSALLSSVPSNQSIDVFLKKTENVSNDQDDLDSIDDNDGFLVDETSSVSTDPFLTKNLNEPEDDVLAQDWEDLDESEKQDLLAVKFLFNSRTTFPEFGVDIVDASAPTKTSYEKNINVNTWEDNWLFKKRKLKDSIKTSVSMLVPSPNEPVKAFIGNEDAEQTSDLSDCSDSELENLLNSSDDHAMLYDVDHDSSNQSPASYSPNFRRRGSGDNESGIFEERVLKGSLTNLALRSRDSSQQFTINPLFLDDSCYSPVDDRPKPQYTSLQHPNKTKRKLTLTSQPSLVRTTMNSLTALRQTRPLS